MKETSFIEQNKKKWNRFEELYESKSNDPEELSNLYMDITDDLSYAQTFYKRRTVRVYLNQLAQKVYTGVHKQKGESFKKFITVWKTSLPLEIYRSRKSLLFALIAFLVYVAIGVLTTHLDPDFARTVLGDGYVEMTLTNIQNGNPLAVYNEADFDGEVGMFVRITTNNLQVAFVTFFVGFFFTVGTHILMFYNGVMLGTFQYWFHTKGLLITSFLGIWIHGAFEISAIVLAGGAGITAGNGLLFPGSYTRMQSLQLSTKRGLKIMLSLVPFIIAAGFLESFVTANYQDLPNWSKWAIIMLSFGLILFFYVFYPMYVARKHPELIHQEEVGNFKAKSKVDFSKIRAVGEVLADSFKLYRRHFGKFMKVSFIVVFPLMAAMVFLQDINHYEAQQTEFWYDWLWQLEYMIGYGFKNMQDFFMCIGWTFIFTLLFCATFWSIKSGDEAFSWKSYFQYVRKRGLGIWLANLLLAAVCIIMFLIPIDFVVLTFILAATVVPFFFLNSAAVGLDNESFGKRYGRGFKYSLQHYGKSLVLLLILIPLIALMMQPIASVFSIHNTWTNEPQIMSDFLDLAAGFVKRIAQMFTDDYMIWSNALRQLVYLLCIIGILPLVIIVMSLGYYSELEKTEANGLKKAFEKFGKRSRSHETNADFE